jgi:hypothetical protein
MFKDNKKFKNCNSKDYIDPLFYVKYLESKGIKVDDTPVCVLEYHFCNSNT